MTTTTREQIKQYVKDANIHGRTLSTPVAYQLLEICNNEIGAARVYWSEWGQEEHRQRSWDFTPNQIKEKFVSTVSVFLEQRVNHAYMLSPEQRQAAEIFRTFYNHAAQVDWNDREAFEQLSREYDGIHQSVRGLVEATHRKVSSLRMRRIELMHVRGLPYRETSL